MTMLEIRGLNTYYGESHILRDVDLRVLAGEMVCLIGRNGVGKTTLLKSLIGLLKPRSGEIIFEGHGMERQPPHQRARSGLGYVPQGREIIPQLTVEENLMLGMEALPGGLAHNRRIDPFIYELFPILQEFLSRKGGDLSGGQQQRVAIARSLVNDPFFVLADEPTGNLDSATTDEILAIFDQLNDEGRTIILVTHEDDVADRAKRIVRLKDGMLHTDELVSDERRVAARLAQREAVEELLARE